MLGTVMELWSACFSLIESWVIILNPSSRSNIFLLVLYLFFRVQSGNGFKLYHLTEKLDCDDAIIIASSYL